MDILNRSYNHINEGNARLDVRAYRHKVSLIRLGNVTFNMDSYSVTPAVESSYTLYGCYIPSGSGYTEIEGQSIQGTVSTLYLRQWPRDLDITWRVDISGDRFRIRSIENLNFRDKVLKLRLEKLGSNEESLSRM